MLTDIPDVCVMYITEPQFVFANFRILAIEIRQIHNEI